MKKVVYAYDVLHYETFESDGFAFSIRIKKYRLNSRYPLISASIGKVPIISDFSQMPDDYENQCVTVELRFRSSMTLDQMIVDARQFCRDKFLQQVIDFDLSSIL